MLKHEYQKIGSFFVNCEQVIVGDPLKDTENINIENVLNGHWCSLVSQDHKYFSYTNLELISIHFLYEGSLYTNLLMEKNDNWVLVGETESSSELVCHFDKKKFFEMKIYDHIRNVCEIHNIMYKAEIYKRYGCISECNNKKIKTFILFNNESNQVIGIKTVFK